LDELKTTYEEYVKHQEERAGVKIERQPDHPRMVQAPKDTAYDSLQRMKHADFEGRKREYPIWKSFSEEERQEATEQFNEEEKGKRQFEEQEEKKRRAPLENQMSPNWKPAQQPPANDPDVPEPAKFRPLHKQQTSIEHSGAAITSAIEKELVRAVLDSHKRILSAVRAAADRINSAQIA
jgi:hypothetical protein